jgi:hypothetical protein
LFIKIFCSPTNKKMSTTPVVHAVCCSDSHSFTKPVRDSIRLVAGLGVEGDAHAGKTVQHLSRIARDPSQPNLRQVHLMHSELHTEMGRAGFSVTSGDLGENITTRGLDLLGLPTGTRLRIGPAAIVEITGLRNPCAQIERYRKGLLAVCLEHAPEGPLIRKAGVMGIVVAGGVVRPGDPIIVERPSGVHRSLQCV